MHVHELKLRLARILSEEEGGTVDWPKVQDLSLELYDQLQSNPPADYPAELVSDYLSGFERRSKDPAFAAQQREQLVSFLRS